MHTDRLVVWFLEKFVMDCFVTWASSERCEFCHIGFRLEGICNDSILLLSWRDLESSKTGRCVLSIASVLLTSFYPLWEGWIMYRWFVKRNRWMRGVFLDLWYEESYFYSYYKISILVIDGYLLFSLRLSHESAMFAVSTLMDFMTVNTFIVFITVNTRLDFMTESVFFFVSSKPLPTSLILM